MRVQPGIVVRIAARAVVCLTVALAATLAVAETTAEFYQGLQHFDANGLPSDGTPLARLLASFPTNTESLWEPPAPRPPGVGPTATRVFVTKSVTSSSWTDQCGNPCAATTISYVVSIYFPDSLYIFSYSRQDLVCGSESSVSIFVGDEASMAEPLSYSIRSFTLSILTSGRDQIDEASFSALRAPSGGLLHPLHNLDALVGGRDELELRTGPGGTLDLRAFSPSNPVLTLSVPTSIFADTILLPPGASLNSLFAVSPTVGPGTNLRSLKVFQSKHPNVLGRGADEAAVSILNLGNQQEMTLVSWSDTLGWAAPGAVTRVLAPFEVKSVTIPLTIPEAATSCEEDLLGFSVNPFSFGTPETLQISIYADYDLDGDGYENSVDDCYAIADRTQSDRDNDFQGDLCDLDDGVIHLLHPQHDVVSWQEEQGFDSWNVYRGSLDVLRSGGPYTQIPGSNLIAARTCGVGAPQLADPFTPAPSQAAFYLVTGVASGVEGGLGTDSAGQARQNTDPCP